MVNLANFRIPKACCQKVLPDSSTGSTLINQKSVENAKIQKFKCDATFLVILKHCEIDQTLLMIYWLKSNELYSIFWGSKLG